VSFVWVIILYELDSGLAELVSVPSAEEPSEEFAEQCRVAYKAKRFEIKRQD
jgi:hypothetical protein